jgi:hypothetical protein
MAGHSKNKSKSRSRTPPGDTVLPATPTASTTPAAADTAGSSEPPSMQAMFEALTITMNASMNANFLQIRSELASKADLTAAVAPVITRMDAIESRLLQLESDKDNPMIIDGDGTAAPSTTSAAAPRRATSPRMPQRSAAASSAEQPTRASTASSANPLRLIMKGAGRPLTRTIWLEVYKAMIDYVPMSAEFVSTMKPKPQNERASLFIDFLSVDDARAYKSAFDDAGFSWHDTHTGETVMPRLMRDVPEHIRKKTAKLQHLYAPAWALLRSSAKFVDGTHKLTISGQSDAIVVKDSRDIWFLFTRQDGVMKPNYKECSRMGIDKTMADKFIESNCSSSASAAAAAIE